MKIRDTIHGIVNLSPDEMAIIDTKPFQRLRHIRQLATTYLVYPGAEHTRFGHSIGVMHIASRVIQGLRQKQPSCFYDDKNLQSIHWDWMEQMLRLMALTHDLGHPPFSHAGEELLPQKCKHEDYTREIILNTEIGPIIDRIGKIFNKEHGTEQFEITAQAVVNTYLGDLYGNDQQILNFLMDSELDCDKMDYLLRDSHYCGVSYGHYDLERLLSAIDIGSLDDEKVQRIAVNEDGLHAFEEFVLARYFMFLQVYFHKTRRVLDMTLQRYLKKLLPNGYPQVDKIDDYLLWDDDRVLQSMIENKNWDEVLHFTERKFPRMVYQTSAHMDDVEKERFDKIVGKIVKKNICNKNELIEDDASKLPHNIPSMATSDEKAVYILKKDGQTTNIKTLSYIINQITAPIKIHRLYGPPDRKKEIRDYITEMMI